jgi:hypothetical protein
MLHSPRLESKNRAFAGLLVNAASGLMDPDNLFSCPGAAQDRRYPDALP